MHKIEKLREDKISIREFLIVVSLPLDFENCFLYLLFETTGNLELRNHPFDGKTVLTEEVSK
jgi:hypothetical protein